MVSFIHGNPNLEIRMGLLADLIQFVISIHIPSVALGDFNAYNFVSKKSGEAPPNQSTM